MRTHAGHRLILDAHGVSHSIRANSCIGSLTPTLCGPVVLSLFRWGGGPRNPPHADGALLHTTSSLDQCSDTGPGPPHASVDGLSRYSSARVSETKVSPPPARPGETMEDRTDLYEESRAPSTEV